MPTSDPGSDHAWPPVPRTPEDWLLLEELTLGRHLVADIGWVSARRERAVVAGVTELPAPHGNLDDGYVLLPAVTVVAPDGSKRMFRLWLAYVSAIRQVAARHAGEGELKSFRMLLRLPCHFLFGDRQTVFLLPDNELAGDRHLN